MTSEVPSPTELGRLAVLFETVVPIDYIDHNGHMNVARFLDLHIRASSRLLAAAGADEAEYTTKNNLGFFTVEHHVRYVSEVRAHQHIAAHGLVTRRSVRSMQHLTYLLNVDQNRVASYCRATVVHVDLHTRTAVPLLPDVADRMDRLMAAGLQAMGDTVAHTFTATKGRP